MAAATAGKVQRSGKIGSLNPLQL